MLETIYRWEALQWANDMRKKHDAEYVVLADGIDDRTGYPNYRVLAVRDWMANPFMPGQPIYETDDI